MNERNLNTANFSSNEPIVTTATDRYEPPALTVYGSLTELTLSFNITPQNEDIVAEGGLGGEPSV